MTDLPLEIWLTILSYLPKGFLRRMYAVNRPLFILAMDDIYRQVKIISDGPPMLKLLDQLEHRNIAQNVRSLYLRPTFLPQMWDSVNHLSTLSNYLSSHLEKVDNAASVMKRLPKVLSSCPNIDEVTIVLHDLDMTGKFRSLLSVIWVSVGSNLQRLSLDVTLAKLFIILQPLAVAPSPFPCLQEFSLTLARTRIPFKKQGLKIISDVIVPFLSSIKATLRSLSITSSEELNLAPLFHKMPLFSQLRNFSLFMLFNHTTCSDLNKLSHFLRHHPNIQHFMIRARPTTGTSFRATDLSYPSWITDCLPTLLPNLSSLDISLRPVIGGGNTKLVPDFSPLALNLRSLTFGDCTLDHAQLEAVVNALVHGSSGCAPPLEELCLHVRLFCPQVLRLLATKLLRLNKLDLTYTAVVMDADPQVILPWKLGYDVKAVKASFLSCSYPNWRLRELRLAMLSTCGAGHIEEEWMQVFKKCVLSIQVMATTDLCSCLPQHRLSYSSSARG